MFPFLLQKHRHINLFTLRQFLKNLKDLFYKKLILKSVNFLSSRNRMSCFTQTRCGFTNVTTCNYVITLVALDLSYIRYNRNEMHVYEPSSYLQVASPYFLSHLYKRMTSCDIFGHYIHRYRTTKLRYTCVGTFINWVVLS